MTYPEIRFILITFLITMIIASASAGMFRADPRHTGIYDDNGIRPNNILKWSAPLGPGNDEVYSSAAVVDNVVYIGSGGISAICALDASNGTQIWSYFTGARVESSPSVANGTVYAGSNDGNIYALNAGDGTWKWTYPTNGSVTSSPVIAGGSLYIGSSDHSVYAIFTDNGTMQWRFPTGDEVESSPAVADGTVYVGSFDRNVYAINALDGTQVWTFTTGGWVRTSPSVVNGTVYAGSNDGNLYALDAGNGTMRWHYQAGGYIASSPAVVNEIVYFGSFDTRVYALDALDGGLRWSALTGSPVISSPAFAGGIIYVGCDDNRVYAFNASTGDRVWRFATGGRVLSSPAVANGTVYVGSMDGHVYAIGNSSAPSDSTPPMSVTTLTNTTYASNYITWTWTDPPDPDFAAVRVYLDGVLRSEIPKGIQQYNATGLAQDSTHTISTRTLDSSDNMNITWVNHSAHTASLPPRLPKTYFVRVNGGNATLCDGLTNTDYSEGANGHCALSHPFWALPPTGTPVFQGGDTLVIQLGTYRMGYGAPNTDTCNTGSPWECRMAPVPSGSPEKPTRILGEGWNTGCTGSPVLYGAERSQSIIDLTGSNHVEVSCLELTDHSQCIESHPTIACNRDTYPFGNWSMQGIFGSDSGNVTLRDLNIHGFADRGIRAGRLSNWSIINTTIAFNGYVGWDGDIDGTDSNSGLMYFKNVNISWNGCGEDQNHQPIACFDQNVGGYGDGLGTGFTGGDWVFEDCRFLHSTSDGLDLLYHNGTGSITLRRVWSEGNTGNQVKVEGTTSIENSVIIGNCGFFENKSFTYSVSSCRAGGDALVLDFANGSKVSVVNSEIYGEGNILILAGTEHLPCNGAEELVSRNNIFVGGPRFAYPAENSSLFWNEPVCTGLVLNNNHSVIYGVRTNPCPLGDNDICTDPGIGAIARDLFSMKPPGWSPAIDQGLPVGTLVGTGMVPDHDIELVRRPQNNSVDIGAYEYREISHGIKGDFNRNSRIDIGDVTLVAYMAANLITPDLHADFTNDGHVDIVDAAKIAWYYVGKIPEL